MNTTTAAQLVEQFKQRSIRNMLQNRDRLEKVKDTPGWKDVFEAADKAAVEPELHWREHWEPGGEYHVPELIMEDFTEYRSFGDGEVRNMGVATIKPMDTLYVHPSAINVLISVLQSFENDLNTAADPIPLAAKMHAVAMMIAKLQDAAGQFVVYSMSFNAASISEHAWIVLYGDVCGLSDCKTAEEAQERISAVRQNGCSRQVEMTVGFLHWDYLKPFVDSRLVLPIEQVHFTP